MDNKRKVLYDQLSKDYDLGDFESFSAKLNDEGKRKAFYDAVSKDYDLGDYESFVGKIGDQKEVEPYTHEYDKEGNLVGGTAYQAPESYQYKPEVQQYILQNKPDMFRSKTVDMYGSHSKSKTEMDMLQEGRLYDMKEARQNWLQRPITTFGEAFEQGSEALYQGGKNLVGEAANVVTGSQRDFQRAKTQLDELIESGYDLSNFDAEQALKAYKDRDYQRKMNEWQRNIASRKAEREDMGFFESLLHKMKDPSRPKSQYEETGLFADELQLARSYQAIQDALQKSNGNIQEAYKLLGQNASKETWGDETTREARQALANQRPTEGFGAWVGGMIPQMIGTSAGIVASLNPYTRWLARPLGIANMAFLTGATSGMSMAEARKYAEEKGLPINEGEVWRTGLVDAAIEYGTEKIPFNRYFGRVQDVTKKIIGKGVADAALNNDVVQNEVSDLLQRASKEFRNGLFTKENLKEYLKDVGTEGVSEFMAEALQTLSPIIYQNPEDYPTLVEVLNNGLEGAKGGLFMGAFLGGGSLYSANRMQNYSNRKRREKQGSVSFVETDKGIFEVLGQNNGVYSVMDSNGEQSEVTADQVKDQVSVSLEEFDSSMNEARESHIQEAVEAENASIDAMTNLSTGEYIEVDRWVVDAETGVRIPQPGNIVGWIGEAPVFVPEGMENTEENRIVLKPNEWNPDTVQRMPAEQVKAVSEEMIREEAAQQAEMEAKYAPEVIDAQMQQGVPFNTPTSQIIPVSPLPEGNGWVVEEYALDTNNKVAKTPIVRELTNDEYRDMLQAQIDAQEAAAAPVNNMTSGESVGEQVNAGVNAPVNNVQPAAEGVATEQQAVQPQAPVVPTKEDGSIDYVSYGKDNTFKALGEKYGEKMPNKVAVTAKALASDLKKAKQKLVKAEEALDNAPIGREQKAEEARNKAMAELDAIQKEADFWAEMDADIKNAQAQREAILNPQADVDASTEPMTTDEFIAQQLAVGNIVLSKDDYMAQTGYGNEEVKSMNGGAQKLITDNGMTLDAAGERLMEMDRENGTNFFNQDDATAGRDALIELLGSVRTRKELNQYIAENRKAQAKKESEAIRNASEEYVMSGGYESLEDYLDQMEAAEMENPFLEDRADEIMAIFAEEAAKYEQSINNTENGQGTENENAERSDSVLPEEQSDDSGRTEDQPESERVGDGIGEESEGTHEESEDVKAPLRKRAKEWEQKLGVKVNLIESLDEITNREVIRAIKNGQRVTGWFEESTGEVCFYMPYLESENEVDSTYIHEVVAHKGLRGLLGDKFDAFCDEVWESMSVMDKAKFITYPGVDSIKAETEEETIIKKRRAAADEYIAHLAENIDVTDSAWGRFTEFVKRFLKAIGLEPKMTNADIANLIKLSYANLKSGAEGVSGEGTRFSAKKKRALETVSTSRKKHQQTVISSADGAKILNNLDNLAEKYENDTHTREKTFIGEVAKAIEARKQGSGSQYATFETVNGNVVTIRLADHNATVSNFDNRDENEGISIVVSAKDNNGITNDGDAHIVEYFYDSIDLRRADGKPLAEIVKSIKQSLYSGEFKDTTGLAERQEVNESRFRVVYHGSGSEFDRFDHSFMGTGAGSQVFGWGTYVTESDVIGRDYANIGREATDDDIKYIGDFGEYVGNDVITTAKSFLRDANYNLERAKEIVNDYLSKNVPESTRKGGEFLLGTNENDWTYDLRRHFYEVDIPDEKRGNYIVWGNNVTDAAAKKVFDGIYKLLSESEEYDSPTAKKELKNELDGLKSSYGQGQSGIWKDLYGDISTYLGSDKEASLFLNSLGYVGIKYPAGTIYQGDYGGAHNYVIFNENDLKIVQHTRFRMTNAEKEALRDSEESKALFDYAKKRFGRTFDLREAGYVLPDGSMLDFSGRHEMSPGSDTSFLRGDRTVDHRYVQDLNYEPEDDGGEKTGFKTDMADFINRGAIRIDNKFGLINLSMKPTKDQKVILQRLIQKNDGDVYLDFADGWNAEHHAEYEGVKPMRIFSDIDKYYDEGIKPVGNTRFRFIGERGARNLDKAEEATTRIDNLAVAREMEASEKDAKVIKMATGWERGADGLWRYEVDDSIDFELRRPKKAELKKAYEEANEKYYKLEMRVPTRIPKSATEEEKQRIKELRKELAKLRKVMNKAFDAYYDYSAESATLGEFLGKDNQLFKEYPELADYDVSFLRDSKKLAEGLKGSFTPEYKVIWVDDARPKGDIKSTLVHEIQHAIQGIEGFAQGGTPAAFASAKYQAEEWKANFNEFINRYGFEDWSKNLPIEDWMKYGKEYKGQFGGLHRAFIDNAVEDEDAKKTLTKELDYVKAAYDKFYQIAGGMDAAYKFKDANEWYRSLSGEVESRNVQQRMGMTDEQRRNALAESTEDVSREDQVFLKDGIESGETRFRSVNEPVVDYVSQANNVVEVPRDEVMYTMNNIANQLYKTSGRFMRQLYKYGTLGRVLKGEYAEIDQIKAKNEYDHAKPILEEYLNELVWMKYQATEAAQEVINDVISDVEYAMQYYKDLSLGKDVWRTQSSPRFRISEKGKQIQVEVDKFSSKYNSKPVVLVDSEMTDEELEAAVPGESAEDLRKALKDENCMGGYLPDTDKIYIFVDNQPTDDVEGTMFHENVHGMFHDNVIVDAFDKASDGAFKAAREEIAKLYAEKHRAEELFAYVVQKAMNEDDFKHIEKYLSGDYKETFYNKIKEFGYDTEEEIGRRTVGRRTGSDNQEVRTSRSEEQGASEEVVRKEESARERKERLGKLLDQVADMGLEGVLGNKAYSSMMVDIYKAMPEDVRAEIADDAIRHYGGSVAPAVNDFIGPKSDGSFMDKVVAIVREALRKIGIGLDLNANEVRYMAWRSKKPLDRKNLMEVAEDIDMRYRLKAGEYDSSPTENKDIYEGDDNAGVKFRVVTDARLIEELESSEKRIGYRNVVLNADGSFGSPMADKLGKTGGGKKKTSGFEIGKWEQAEENPDLVDENGKIDLIKPDGKQVKKVDYNPYIHNRLNCVNRQFKQAWERPDLVYVETEIPMVDLESGYHADKAKKPVGEHKWNGGNLILSRYDKPVRVVEWEEVANDWEKAFKKSGIHFDIVPPALLPILAERGVEILPPHKGMGEECNKAYQDFLNEKPDPNGGGARFRVSNKLQVRDEYEANIRKGGYQAREAVQDAMLSLRRFQELIEKATGEKIRDFENAWMHENRLSSVVQAKIHEMERKFYKPMVDAVKKVMEVANLEQEQVADYLMLKHGIERNREMAVRKALTDSEGKIDRTRLEQWYQEKDAIRNDDTLDTWRKKQEAMDNAALNYGADMSRDYSGLTSMFDTDDIEECTNKAYDEVEALETDHPVETEALGKSIKAMTQNTLDESFGSGLMDRKVYNELSKDMYDYYIPLRGFEETTSDEVYAYLDQDRGAFNAPLQRAKGRSSKSDNPIAYLKSIAESGLMQGERNKMKQSFLNLVINHPSDLVSVREGVWAIFNPATGEWEAAAPPTIPNNATPADIENIMEAWDQQMEQAAQNDPTLVKKVAEAADVPYRVVGNKMNQHQIIVKRLGKSYTLTINGNPRLAMALNGLTNPNNRSNDGKVAAYVSGKIDALNRSLAAWYTTRNPDFVASNFMRDTFYTNTIVRAKEGNKYANKFHKNYAMVLPQMLVLFGKYEKGTLDPSKPTEAAFIDFMMNGGETGYSNLKDLEHIKKQIAKELKGNRFAKVEALAEKLDILNRAVENTARFAAFLTSREMGRSIAKSVFDAKEISVNFNKKGAGGTFFGMTGQTKFGNLAAMVGAGGRALYVFFNAAIQGSTNLMHVMKVNPKGTSAGLAAMFLMGAVVPFLFGDDDDEKGYYDLPEHVRRNHLIIPGTGDAWISIPLPIEYRIMYGMGELLTSWRTGHERGKDIARKMLSMSGQALPLNFLEEGFEAFVPSSISPLWQVYNNRSWTGLPIYKDNEFNKDDPEYTKAYKNVDRGLYNFTKALYHWTFDEENQEEGIDLNPAVIESLARGYFGGLATQLGNIVKTAETIAGEREFDWRSIPIGNRLFKSGDERTKEKRVTNEYFENMEKLDFLQSRERTLKKTINGEAVPQADKEQAKIDDEIMRGSEVFKKYQEFKKLKKVVDKIRKTMKEKGSTPEREKQLIEAQEAANKAVR